MPSASRRTPASDVDQCAWQALIDKSFLAKSNIARELAATLLEERGLPAGGAPPDVVAFGGPREDEVREPPRPARLSLGVEVDEDIWAVPERRENFSTGDPIAVKGRGKSFTRVGDRGLLRPASGRRDGPPGGVLFQAPDLQFVAADAAGEIAASLDGGRRRGQRLWRRLGCRPNPAG